MIITTAYIASTSKDVEIETTINNIETTAIHFDTDAPTIISTTRATTTTTRTTTKSITTSPTTTLSQTTLTIVNEETSTTPVFITENQTETDFSTLTVPSETKVSSTFLPTTETTALNTDEEVNERTTTESLPNKSSRLGIILGSLAGVFVVIVLVILYLKRRRSQAQFVSQSPVYQEITPMYSNSNSSGGFVRLENLRERTSSA
jgi:hypothetical protein